MPSFPAVTQSGLECYPDKVEVEGSNPSRRTLYMGLQTT